MHAIHTETLGDYKLTIHYDPDPINWRKEGETLGTLFCKHRRYNLSDEGAEDAFTETDEGRKMRDDIFVAVPVYMYEHSGIQLRAGKPFSDPWDSGLVGVIYVTTERARAEYGDLTGEARVRCVQALTAEIEEYSKYISGEVYAYRVEGPNGVEETCGGFYGAYDGPDGALEAGRAALKGLHREEKTR